MYLLGPKNTAKKIPQRVNNETLITIIIIIIETTCTEYLSSQWAGHPTQEPGITAEANCASLDIR